MRRTLCSCAIVIATVLVRPSVAAAQEKGQFGVTLAYPPAVGVIWHVADRVAVRPDFTFTQLTSDLISTTTITFGSQRQTMVTTSSSTNTAVGFGVAALVYLWKRDAARAYVSPRYNYSRATITPSSPEISSQMTTNNGASGSFGAQYTLSPHFNVFGEVGVAYNHGSISTKLPDSVQTPIAARIETTNRSVGMRSAAGVTLYF